MGGARGCRCCLVWGLVALLSGPADARAQESFLKLVFDRYERRAECREGAWVLILRPSGINRCFPHGL
jgi:hypothetical protein